MTIERISRKEARRQEVDPAYTRVNEGHVVPAGYQRNFADGDRVLRHDVNGSRPAEIRNVSSVGTYGPIYRRQRPDGTFIDDTEWSLTHIEDAAAALFKEIRTSNEVGSSDKAILAEFFGHQLARSPTFYGARRSVVEKMISAAPAAGFQPGPVAEHGLDRTRELATKALLRATPAHRAMLGMGSKMTAAMAAMQWSVIRFAERLLVYSDRPVVVWPASVDNSHGFRGQQLPPIDAIEIRIPLNSSLALLLSWADLPDFAHFDVPGGIEGRLLAGELNQMTIAQAQDEWAHHPDIRPPRLSPGNPPLSPRLWEQYGFSYGPDQVFASGRRRHVLELLSRRENAENVKELEVLDVLTSRPTAPIVRPQGRRTRSARKRR